MQGFFVKVIVFCLIVGFVSGQCIAADAPYKDANLSIEERVNDLLPSLAKLIHGKMSHADR